MRKALIGPVLLSLVSAALIGAVPDKPSLSKIVAALDAAQPLSPRALEAALGIKLACDTERHCAGGPLELADAHFAKVDLRHGGFGSILVLEEPGDQCLPMESVGKEVDFGMPLNGCTHAICMYRSAKRPWGNIHLGVPRDLKASQCVTSIVFNAGL